MLSKKHIKKCSTLLVRLMSHSRYDYLAEALYSKIGLTKVLNKDITVKILKLWKEFSGRKTCLIP